MDKQFKLTIQTASPVGPLVETLLSVGEAVTMTASHVYWDTGLGVQSQQVMGVEIILGDDSVPLALVVLQTWHSELNEPPLVLEIQETFARRFGVDD